MNRSQSDALFAEALKYIPGGVNSPVRAFRSVGGAPFFTKSAKGATLTTADGRATILMPHPERVFRTVQNSWHPAEWGEDSGWMRMFRNARVWVG